MNPWARHFQAVWQERSGDPRLPAWLRVACLVYGSHTANGHATFKPGQIALVLAKVDQKTGEVRVPSKYAIRRAIASAVEYGWLAKESGSLCLVVPGHAINGGLGGKPDDECPRCDRRIKVDHSVTHLDGEGGSLSEPQVDHSATHAQAADLHKRARSSDSSNHPHPTANVTPLRRGTS